MAADWLRYQNQGATRNRPLDPRLVDALGQVLPNLGLTMDVFSGGQAAAGEGGPRTGSVRHDHGGAADAFFYRDGHRLDWANPNDRPIFEDIVRQGRAAGITGFGAGPGYMQPGSMHIGFGAPGVWGAGGKGANAPDWLRAAYGGAPAGAAPSAPASLGAMYADAAPQPAPAVAAPAHPLDQLVPQAMALMTGGGNPPPAASAGAAGVPPQGGDVMTNLAALFVQGQQNRQRQREEEQAAADARRLALLGGGDLAGLYGA